MLRTASVTLFLLIFNCLNTFGQVPGLYFPPKTGTVWQTINPASLGFCPERIDSLYAFLETHNTKSFMLLQDGKIVLEKYFGTFTQDSLWYWASAGKSATAFMIGQAQEQALLNIDAPTSTYLGAGWTVCPPDKEALITVHHQLTMTSGLDDNLAPTAQVPDPDNCTDSSCLVYKADAGTRWAYHNAPYRLLHAVLESASGVTINQFTKSHLLDPTGMKAVWYDHILYSRTRDMARFGLLALAGGVWGSDTLLHDQAYFYNMTHRSQQLNKSYGYLWWLNGQESFMLPGLQVVFPWKLFPNAPDDLYAALGKNDQKIHVVPSKHWVVIRMGNDAGYVSPGGAQVPIYFDNDMWAYLNQLVCNPTAVDGPVDSGKPRLQITPNPASEQGWTISSDTAIEQWVLWDQVGHLLRSGNGAGSNVVQIEGKNMPAGLYYIRIQSGKQAGFLELVKNVSSGL